MVSSCLEYTRGQSPVPTQAQQWSLCDHIMSPCLVNWRNSKTLLDREHANTSTYFPVAKMPTQIPAHTINSEVGQEQAKGGYNPDFTQMLTENTRTAENKTRNRKAKVRSGLNVENSLLLT